MKRRSFLKGIGALFALAAVPAIAVVDKVKPVVESIKKRLSKTVSVYSIADFPTPIDGVINLEPDTEYKIVNPITLPDRFHLNGHGAKMVSSADPMFITKGSFQFPNTQVQWSFKEAKRNPLYNAIQHGI